MDSFMDTDRPGCLLPEACWNHLRQAGIGWTFLGCSAGFTTLADVLVQDSSFLCIILENDTDTSCQRSTPRIYASLVLNQASCYQVMGFAYEFRSYDRTVYIER